MTLFFFLFLFFIWVLLARRQWIKTNRSPLLQNTLNSLKSQCRFWFLNYSISETTTKCKRFCLKTSWVLKLQYLPRIQSINWSIWSSEKSTGMLKSQHSEQGHLFIREQWLLGTNCVRPCALPWLGICIILDQDKQIYPYTVNMLNLAFL